MSGSASWGWLASIADAVIRLSRHRIGAVLILADSTTALTDEGIVIEGRLSTALLVSLFVPESINELSKGAVVVRDAAVERAAVPVLRSTGWDWVGALAHDISAVVVAVSEDDGVVRVGTRQGVTTIVEPSALGRELADHLQGQPGATSADVEPILEVLKRTFRWLTDSVMRGDEPTKLGIPTDFHRYDRLTGGLHCGELAVFAGREWAGVNRFVLQIALNVARGARQARDAGVLILSPNLSEKDMALPMLGALHAVERSPERADWEALSESAATLAKMPIWFDPSPSLTASALKGRIRRLQARLRTECSEARVTVVIPDLLVLGPGETLWGRAGPYEDTLTTLRLVARELDVPIVAAVKLLGGADHDEVERELRRVELVIDRLATLARHTTPEDEVYVMIRGRGHRRNFGFHLRVSPAGVFLQEPE